MIQRIVCNQKWLKFKVLAVVLTALVGCLVVVLERFGRLDLLLTLAAALILVLVLYNLGRRWRAKGYTLSLVVPVILIGFWLTAQVWYNGLPLDWRYLGAAVRWKNYLGILAVAFGLLFVFVGRSINTHDLLFMFSMCLPFLVVSALSIQRRPEPNWLLLGMYTGWFTYAFLIIPGLLRSRRSWVFAIKALVIMVLLMMVWYIWSGVRVGELYQVTPRRRRLIFAFNAPHAYANALLVAILGIVVLTINANRRSVRRRWFLIAAIMSVLLAMSYSRSNLLFLAVFLTSIGLYARWWFRPLLLPVLAVIVLLSIVVGWVCFDYDLVNDISSGRPSVYGEALRVSLDGASLGDWLLGTSFQEIYQSNQQFVRAYHEAVASERYGRAHIENVYLQVFLSRGLLGILAFILPFLVLYVYLHKLLVTCQAPNRINVILAIASLNGLAAYSLVQGGIPSFGNVIAIFMPVLWLPSLEHCAASRRIGRWSVAK